jgi:hypothetical protein
MMAVIEPQFQRDFISLLPKEVMLIMRVIAIPLSGVNTVKNAIHIVAAARQKNSQ